MPGAQDDLRAAYRFYAAQENANADQVVGAILKAANGLARFPLMGRPGIVRGTRERVMTRYPHRIVYRVVDDTIEILRVIHTAQQWP